VTRTAGLILVCAASFAGAQSRVFRVAVVDSLGLPVRGAEARVSTTERKATTDSLGYAVFLDLPEGRATMSIRHIGYVPATVPFTVSGAAKDSLGITLAELMIELDGVQVSAVSHPFIEGFDRRRRQGVGTFVTPRQIADRKASVSSDIFRQIPMVRLVDLPNGSWGIRFQQILSIRQSAEDCVPMLWLDGQRAPGLEIDDVRAGDVSAIELYRGASTVPNDFATSGRTQCGVVVIWTKRYLGQRKGRGR
jgi:hypothetical protein